MCQDSPFNEIIFATDSCSEDDSLFMKGFDTFLFDLFRMAAPSERYARQIYFAV